MNYYLAVDIGASSGRHILASIDGGKIVLEEIYRFENGMEQKDGHLVWNHEKLFENILNGMKKCKEAGKIPESMGIDTWAVDYVLLDKDDKLLGNLYGYRDSRTEGMDELVYKVIPLDKLYARTGIQKQPFNTIYQLMADKAKEPEKLSRAKAMLMVPEYFNFLLTGRKASEYTNATTTQLVSPDTKDWDFELIESLGYPKEIFCDIKTPGSFLGYLKEEIQKEVGFNCKVVLPATHDTGSAVMAVPVSEGDCIYISSGTWSLMGTELKNAECSMESMEKNLTNEGGYDYRFRYLKNIMGLWMINSVKKEIAEDVSFDEIVRLAMSADIKSTVDANDERFLAPESMVSEIKKACKEKGEKVPKNIGELAAVIYQSLAECYKKTIDEIEKITGNHYDKVHIVGGGAKAAYLNGLTAKACKREVIAGPIEATAIGNVVCQMIAAKEIQDLKSARKLIYDSFEIRRVTC